MDKVIFALLGPSGSGKTTLVDEMLRRLPERLAPMRSLTTRPRRSAEDDLAYDFVDREEFLRLRDQGHLVQSVEYNGHFYGDDRRDIERIFASGRHGIRPLVEDGVRNFRAAGYRVAAVRILPVGEYDGRSDERRRIDAERMRDLLAAELEIENRFEPGGFEAAAAELEIFIRSYIEGSESIGPVS